MQSWLIRAYGDPAEVARLEDVRDPQAGASDVVLRVEAASVNPFDVKVISGAMKDFLPVDFPLALGHDAAGVIEQVGTHAGDFKLGERVLVNAGGGAFSRKLLAPAASVARLPAEVSMIEGAALPTAAGTAWEALMEAAGLRSGQTVLVHAASGGVGHFAVQIAHLAGARVIATTSAGNRDLVAGLGAEEVVDYRATDFRSVARDVDVVLDTRGGKTQAQSLEVLRRGGVLVSLTQPPDMAAAEARGIRALQLQHKPSPARLEKLAALVAEGRLRVVIDAGFPFAQLPRALERVGDGQARGKVVVEVGA